MAAVFMTVFWKTSGGLPRCSRISFQILSEVPTEPTDIRPQVIVTEENIYRDAQ